MAMYSWSGRRACLTAVWACAALCGAGAEDGAGDNALLRARLDKLEDELAQLHKAPGAAQKKPATAFLDVELYGYVKLDAAYDNARVSIGDCCRWVEMEAPGANGHQFNLTANQTRLGLRFKGPESKGLQTAGLVEMDFYGGGAANKPTPMMRHAYLTAFWPDLKLGVLAGQTADTISPLTMPTINYTVGWWQGNIGYRRPQLRVTESVELADKTEARLEVAAARSIGRTNSWTGASFDTGQISGYPTVQGRASVSFPMLADKPTVLGVSGHFGQEEYTNSVMLATWSFNGDLTLPITTWLALQAEGFIGENLEAYLGGVGQGVNTAQGQTIRAWGGWVALTLTPCATWQFNVGAGMDDPEDADLATKGRTYNTLVFGNATYFFNPSFSIGLEIARLQTRYKDQPSCDDMREQLALTHKF
ncbi:MAG: hypothetical protein NTV49_13725 [Kiritimatiellaeota bacterium]|nr:hypothetical protein [Kiritimatiellota bacterium]